MSVVDLKRKPDYHEMVDLLDYNPKTGIFTWKVYRGSKVPAGAIAGHVRKDGYIMIGIGKNYLAHRLAIYYVRGYWSENEIDHINKNPTDNRIINLREVSHSCNMSNSKQQKNTSSGIKGVSWCKLYQKWTSHIQINKKQKNLGNFKDFTEAVCHRFAAEQCINYGSCDTYTPAFQYVQKMLGASSCL